MRYATAIFDLVSRITADTLHMIMRVVPFLARSHWGNWWIWRELHASIVLRADSGDRLWLCERQSCS